MFVQVMFLFASIAAMQCTAIANPLLCPYDSATECHEGLRLRHKEMLSHAAGFVHSAAEQSGEAHNKNAASGVVDQIQKLLADSKRVQTDAIAAEEKDKTRAVKAKGEIEKEEKEIQKHKAPSTSGSWWGPSTKTSVFQWDEEFINTAKGYADSASEKAAEAKSKAEEAVQRADALQKSQSTHILDAEAVKKTQQDYTSIEKSIEDANNAIAEVRQNADAAEVAAYYVKTMMVSHDVFKTVENVTYMGTKSKSLIKEAESGIKEAASYLDIIPREHVTQVKGFMESIGALVDPLKELQATSEQAVDYTKALQTSITKDKDRMKVMTSVQEAKCAWERASAAVVLINKVAEPVKSQTPFLNDAIGKVGASKAKGLAAKVAYMWWSWGATKEEKQKIQDAVIKEKEDEKQKKEREGQTPLPPQPAAKLFNPSINIPSEVKLPDCNAVDTKGDQTVNLDAIKTGSDREDSIVPIKGNDQERDVKASDASGSNSERKGDKGESFRRVEQPSSDGAISTKEPVDDEGIRPVDSTESNEFSGNGSSKRGPRREGSRDSASTMPSVCAYALLTLIMFLVTVQR